MVISTLTCDGRVEAAARGGDCSDSDLGESPVWGSPMNDRPLGTKLTLEHARVSDSGVVAAAASLTIATLAPRDLKVSHCMIRPSRWRD